MSRHIGRLNGVLYAVIAVSVLLLMRALPLGEGIAALRSWVEGLGVWGPVVFAAIYVVAVVATIPASLLTLAAGATFGLLVGTITVTIAANVGAALALLIARYLARRKVEQFARRRPRFAAIDAAISEGGWKVVALLRLSPAIPFNVQNYLYGLTSIGLGTCVLTSLFAMLPGTFLYIYLGHAAGTVAGAEGGKSPAQWALLGVGLLATIAVTVYITRLARRKLREQTPIADEGDVSSDDHQQSPTDASSGESKPSHISTVVTACLALALGVPAAATLINPDGVERLMRRLASWGPPPVEMKETYRRTTGGPTFDHAAFNAILQEYVDEDGWVDYDGLSADAQRLDAYLADLADAPFEKLNRDEKLALLLNAYNACTLRLIVDHWPLESIKDIPSAKRWEAHRWTIGGHLWSLNEIEQQQIRPKFNEPRGHFSLVCAAVGCPPLANEAYVASQLESQLQHQAEYVHAHKTWLQINPQRNEVQLTPIYKWYAGDFEQSADSVVAYAARYSPPLKRLLEADRSLHVSYLPYDWSINSMENRRPR